jgi:multicomponent Na+:H+ antiporter subunit F
MIDFFIFVGVLLCVLITFIFYRVFAGPTLFDRLISMGVIGTKTLVLLLLIGFIYKRPDMFVDISLVYTLLNFIGVLAITKYLRRYKTDGY